MEFYGASLVKNKEDKAASFEEFCVVDKWVWRDGAMKVHGCVYRANQLWSLQLPLLFTQQTAMECFLEADTYYINTRSVVNKEWGQHGRRGDTTEKNSSPCSPNSPSWHLF